MGALVSAQVETEVEAEVEPDLEAEVEPDVEAEVESEVEAEIQPEIEAESGWHIKRIIVMSIINSWSTPWDHVTSVQNLFLGFSHLQSNALIEEILVSNMWSSALLRDWILTQPCCGNSLERFLEDSAL